MEEKKPLKISLKSAIIAIVVIIVIFIVLIFLIVDNMNDKIQEISQTKGRYEEIETEPEEEKISDSVSIKKYKGLDYYVLEADYSGEYDLQYISLSEYFDSEYDVREDFEKKEIMNYEDYSSYCNRWGLKQKYSDASKNYIVFSYIAYGQPILTARLADVKFDENDVQLYIWDFSRGITADISAYAIAIPIDETYENIDIIPLCTEDEFDNLKKEIVYEPHLMTVDKPIIYLYPTEETKVSVKLLKEESITHSYPKYNESWNVLANSNGDLKDLKTGKNLYSLYYENESNVDFKIEKEGFIVKGEDVSSFLEEKLKILGLNERETEEFIIYWLPKLEVNKYNYIRFASNDEINENMPLEINPNPDNVIRVLMTYKGLDNSIEVNKQELVSPERTGFVTVEWGGTEIK